MTKKYIVFAFFFIISFQAAAQKKEVVGIITSKENRDLLPGIVVWVKGSNQGLVTGSDGYFDLIVAEGDTIEASSPFFKSQEMIVGSGWHYEILLETKAEERTGFLQLKKPESNREISTVKPDLKKKKGFEGTNKMLE